MLKFKSSFTRHLKIMMRLSFPLDFPDSAPNQKEALAGLRAVPREIRQKCKYLEDVMIYASALVSCIWEQLKIQLWAWKRKGDGKEMQIQLATRLNEALIHPKI